MKEISAGGRLLGRHYLTFLEFIGRIKNGEEPMIFSTDYVVMSQKRYKELKDEIDKLREQNGLKREL